MPEVPTMKAQGYDVVAASSTGMIAPAETPQNVVDTLTKIIARKSRARLARESVAMFTLNPLPPQLAPALVEKLVRAEPATIGHFRHWGFMDTGIKAMQSDVRIALIPVSMNPQWRK